MHSEIHNPIITPVISANIATTMIKVGPCISSATTARSPHIGDRIDDRTGNATDNKGNFNEHLRANNLLVQLLYPIPVNRGMVSRP